MEEFRVKTNLFVPGFAKCGTTALCEYLSQHPDIYVIYGKEPYTLLLYYKQYAYLESLTKMFTERTREDIIGNIMSIHDYKKLLLEHSNYKYRVDGSTLYGITEFAKYIKDFNKDAKILFMIREPKSRLISLFYHTFPAHLLTDIGVWLNKLVIPYKNRLFFNPVINAYYENFGDNMLVIDNATLKCKPRETMNNVFNFLNLDPIIIKPISANVTRINQNNMNKLIYLYSTRKIINKIIRKFLILSGKYNKYSVLKLQKYDPIRLFEEFLTTSTLTNKFIDLTNKIPRSLIIELEDDYNRTIEFCKSRNVYLNCCVE